MATNDQGPPRTQNADISTTLAKTRVIGFLEDVGVNWGQLLEHIDTTVKPAGSAHSGCLLYMSNGSVTVPQNVGAGSARSSTSF